MSSIQWSNFRKMNLREQVAIDLKNYMDQFSDPKKGLRLASIKIGIHKKTLKRLIDQENTPTYLTLYKIYREVFNIKNDSILLQTVPEVVKKELIKENPKDVLKNIQFNVEVENEIISDPVFMDIYFLSNAGILTREFIQFKFGEYGMNIVSKMLKGNILELDRHGVYKQGSNQANLSPLTIKRSALYIINKYFTPSNCEDKGKNFCGIYFEGLTPEGFNEWLKVDYEAFYKKVELSKQYRDPRGIKAFTFVATDSMSEEKL